MLGRHLVAAQRIPQIAGQVLAELGGKGLAFRYLGCSDGVVSIAIGPWILAKIPLYARRSS